MAAKKRQRTTFLQSPGTQAPGEAAERVAANMLLMANPGERYCFGLDLGTPGGDRSVAVLAQKNADGTMTVLGMKEVQPFDLDLTATDVSDQKRLRKSDEK